MSVPFRFLAGASSYDSSSTLAAAVVASATYGLPTRIWHLATAMWGFTGVEVRSYQATDFRSVVLANDDVILVAFRGSIPTRRSWAVNFRAKLVAHRGWKVHRGYLQSLRYRIRSIANTINRFRDRGQPIWFVGHSQGGALATLAAAFLIRPWTRLPIGLITFGQPRTGNRRFAAYLESRLGTKYSRLINRNDAVPHVPQRALYYWHTKRFLHYRPDGSLRELLSFAPRFRKRISGVRDHKMGNYVKVAGLLLPIS